MNKISFTVITTAVTVSSPAIAQANENFSGAKGTVVVGIDRVSTPFDVEIEHPNGVVFGAALGYDLQTGNLVYGVEVELTEATGNQEVGNSEIATGRDIYGGIRLGVAVSKRALLYIKGGYSNFQITAGSSGADNFHGA
ncbi:outer membrane beta-barrel protein, partial [Parasphingorhabdus sp.]